MTATVATGPARREKLLPVLAVLFFLSGVSALIYQILWLRLLGLIFGVTIYAASTVLASFMTGLALGSLAGGRVADRVGPRRTLVCLAITEALIAASALGTPVALRALERVYTSIYPLLPPDSGSLTLIRFLGSFGVLVVPTMLMGATLPLVVRSSLLRVEGLGQKASVLYATNTAGAIAGTLLAGFYLIGRFGIGACFQLAAALNVLVATGAMLVWRALRRTPLEEAVQDPSRIIAGESQGVDLADPARVKALVLAVFALSGFSSLALEVIWVRVLVLFVPATIYAFTTMLATFLTGIAAGSYVVAPLMRRRRDWLALLAVLELGIAIACVISLTILAATYELGWRTSGTTQASVVAMLPATLLMGMAFPIGLRIYAAGAVERVAERIGLFYSLNVGGAIAGTLAAGFLLLPQLGSRRSLVVAAAVNLASGLLLLAALSPRRLRFAVCAGAAGLALFAAAAITLPDPFAAVQTRRYRGERLLWSAEGVQTTVSVHSGPMRERVLYLNGLHQANTTPEMTGVHRQIGHLAMALHPNPREVLVIGLGGGVTAGAVSRHRGARLDIVELSQAVVRSADWFRDVNSDVLRQPNVRLRIDDGRNYLLLTSKRYDVITADVIQPFHAGAGNVYAAEYFRLARKALADDGLMLQWIGHQSEAHYKLIMRTFLSVFPDTTLWADGTLMAGTRRPLRLDPADFARRTQDPATRSALDEVGLTDFEALLGLYTAGPAALERFVGPGPILTDDRPLVEYHRSLPAGDRPVDIAPLRGHKFTNSP